MHIKLNAPKTHHTVLWMPTGRGQASKKLTDIRYNNFLTIVHCPYISFKQSSQLDRTNLTLDLPPTAIYGFLLILPRSLASQLIKGNVLPVRLIP